MPRFTVGSIIGFAPVVAILAGLGVMLADPSRNFVLSVLALGVVAMLVAVLAVHRLVTGSLREALAAAEAEMAAQARSRHIDLTERLQLEAQLLQAQKMEAIGQLASGLAHDFNNTLMVAGGYADLLNAEATSPHLRAYSEAIAGVMQRGTELTRQLLAFARPTDSTIRPADVRPVVTGLVPLIRRLLGSAIEVRVEVPERPMIVRFDACQLEQALINLAINAHDAMPVGGRLTVVVNAGRPQTANTTRTRVSSRGAFDGDIATETVLAARPEEFVEITLRDSGSGIPTEHLDRIFEPFFTTKREGHGSGLGLAMVSRFAARAGGDVSVESAPGAGTTVAIRLPRTEAADRPLPPVGRQPRLPGNGRPQTGRSGRTDRLAASSRV
jgi:signal transduction histidine kinase